VRELIGFQRVTLAAGDSQQVQLHVDAQQLSSWSATAQRWLRGGGNRAIYVSSSSRDPRLQTTITIS